MLCRSAKTPALVIGVDSAVAFGIIARSRAKRNKKKTLHDAFLSWTVPYRRDADEGEVSISGLIFVKIAETTDVGVLVSANGNRCRYRHHRAEGGGGGVKPAGTSRQYRRSVQNQFLPCRQSSKILVLFENSFGLHDDFITFRQALEESHFSLHTTPLHFLSISANPVVCRGKKNPTADLPPLRASMLAQFIISDRKARSHHITR